MKEITNKFFKMADAFEFIASITLFATLFILFIFQIGNRYFFTPLVWTQELCLGIFLWLLCFAACFADQTDENVKFTSCYELVNDTGKLIFDLLSATIVVVSFTMLIPSTVDYIKFNFTNKALNLPITTGVTFWPFLYLVLAFWLKYLKRLIVCIGKIITLLNEKGGAK